MNRATTMFIIATGLLIGTAAHAQGPHVGATLGIMDVDLDAYDSATNAGLVLGWQTRSSNQLSVGVEGVLTTTLGDADFSTAGVNGNWDIDTVAAYGVVRFGDQLYGKGKIGVLHEDIQVNVSNVAIRGDDTGTSIGVGGGYRLTNNVSAEAEYTQIEEDVGFWSLTANLHF